MFIYGTLDLFRLYRNGNGQAVSQYVFFTHHSYMFQLHWCIHHQGVQNYKQEIIYIKVMGNILVLQMLHFIDSFSSLSHDRSRASPKASSPHSAI
jgi:hypothetical protein